MILFNSIWNHLVTLTQTEKITVIITTHYIEEARQANVVGLMRHGRLLAENSPEELLAQNNLETLEEVFLKLCMTDSSARAAALAGGSSLSTLAVDSQMDLSKSFNNDTKNNQFDPKYPSTLSVNSEGSYNIQTSPAGYTSTANLVEHKPNNRAVSHMKGPSTVQTPSSARYQAKNLTMSEYWSTTTALFWKNFTRLRRNIP